MTEVYFVRHAQPVQDDKTESRKLSQKGLLDTKLVSNYLRDKGIDLLLSSPYTRAVETIEPLAKILNKKIKTIKDFREINAGGWFDDFNAFTKKQWNDFDYKVLNGESLKELQTRNIKALNKVLKEYKDKTICIGTHGTALSMIINYYDNTFNHNDFIRIQNQMPWIVYISFNDNKNVVSIKEVYLN